MNGIITEIIGPVVDVHFSTGSKQERRPSIGDALIVAENDAHARITLEVASHLGLDRAYDFYE